MQCKNSGHFGQDAVPSLPSETHAVEREPELAVSATVWG